MIDTPSPIVAPLVTGYFDEGPAYQTYRELGTTDWLIICTVAGAGRFRTQDFEHTATPGDITLIAPRAMHDYATSQQKKRWAFHWAHFVPMTHWSRLLDLPELTPGLLQVHLRHSPNFHTVLDSFEHIHSYATNGSSLGKELAMNALETVLICCHHESSVHKGKIDQRIANSMEGINSNLRGPWFLDSLASSCNLSSSRFAHLFRTEVGVTPQQYIEARRIERARQLLALSGMRIQDIALEVGYENAFYFSNRFKAAVGVSPKAFRESTVSDRNYISPSDNSKP